MAAEPTLHHRLTARARRILYALISEYIATGEPVGSRRLTTAYGFDLSPATIRNVLADLEDAGLVKQPHTSAGRVPTDLGFRIFVDALVQLREIGDEERSAIVSRIQDLGRGEQGVREAGRVLAALAGGAALITLPKIDHEALKELRFIPLRDGELLAILIAGSGLAENRVIRVSRVFPAGELERIHNFLHQVIAGRSLKELRDQLAQDMDRERDSYQKLKQQAVALLDAVMAEEPRHDALLIEGQDNLFAHPEFADGEKIKQFLHTFEERARLLELLDHTLMVRGVQVTIGSEANLSGVQDVSIISAAYDPAGGAVAVVGLTRMDYAKVMPLVSFTADILAAGSEGSKPPDPEEG